MEPAAPISGWVVLVGIVSPAVALFGAKSFALVVDSAGDAVDDGSGLGNAAPGTALALAYDDCTAADVVVERMYGPAIILASVSARGGSYAP